MWSETSDVKVKNAGPAPEPGLYMDQMDLLSFFQHDFLKCLSHIEDFTVGFIPG